MTDKYTAEDFSRGMIPASYKKEVKDLIEMAVMLGWTMYVTSNAGITLVSHDDAKRYNFTTKKSSGPLPRIKRDIVKYADPVRVKIAEDVRDGRITGDFADAVVATMHKTKPPVVMARPEDEPPKERFVKPEPAPVPQPVKQQAVGTRRLVSAQPMIAKSGDKLGYPSETTIERKWSDGTTDYKCARCDYTSDNRKSVSSHWPKHVKADESARVGDRNPFPVVVTDATVYAPQKRRVDALAACIQDLMDAGVTDPNAIALKALTWVHDQSRHQTDLAAEREELDDSDILNRIRTLLDMGTYARQQAEIDRLADANRELQEAVEVANAKAQRAAETLKALAELAAENGTDG